MSTIREKRYSIIFGLEDILDVKLLISEGGLLGFVLSYRARIGDEWCEVFRVDTAHGYLHMQRFWESRKPRGLREFEDMPLEAAFYHFLDRIKGNWKRYRTYMERRMR